MERFILVPIKVEEFINGGQPDGFYAAFPVNGQDAILGFGATADEAFANLVVILNGTEAHPERVVG